MRLSFVAAVLLTSSLAGADPLAFSVATHGTTLDFTITNRSTKPITMTTHVRAGSDHYDWLTVRLSGVASRTMHFLESRTKAIPIDETIAPGGSVTHGVDLAEWAIRADNGDALAAGAYDLEAVWESKLTGKLVATTKLVVPAPVEKRCSDSSSTGLVLLAYQVKTSSRIDVGIHNVDKVKHCVAAYIKTYEIQSDQLVLDYTYPTTSKTTRRLHFNDDRDRSAEIIVELEPGATSWTTWDVAAWALRGRNGKQAVPAGETVWATAIFDATSLRGTWSGALQTSFGLRFP